ncbi:AzlC family ABC transporter permease [Euzebya pacifica]|uniref:AzlC family ABC transporter permease n=1 Tax=Euzebya pacifica TaxID=1608957 RepID=UPI003C6CF723
MPPPPASSSTTFVSTRSAVLAGVRDISPVVLGMAPFGLLAGIAAIEAGMPAWGASIFSTFVFAGAAQLAALDLIAQDAAAPIVIGTIVVINARFLMYSASLAVHLGAEPARRRLGVAYLLTDQAYAVTIARLTENPRLAHRVAYYTGAGGLLWTCWQGYTVTGTLAGAAIPDDVPIEFAIPLVFAALLVPALTDRATLAAALTSALVATLAADLPANLGLLLAAAAGVAVGLTTSVRGGSFERQQAPKPGGQPLHDDRFGDDSGEEDAA